MARRRYLMAYDIADPKRLRQICTLMEEYGQRLQYSVFLCDLSPAERAELETAATTTMNLSQDSIIQIDLGATTAPTHPHLRPTQTPPRHRPHDRVTASAPVPPQPPGTTRTQLRATIQANIQATGHSKLHAKTNHSQNPLSSQVTRPDLASPDTGRQGRTPLRHWSSPLDAASAAN